MSAAPGWYPDPSGQPNSLRRWDGARWTDDVRPATPGYPLSSQNGGPPRRGRIALFVVGALVFALVIGLLAWRPWDDRVRPDTAADEPTSTVSGWDETSEPTATEDPSDTEDKGSATSCPWVNSGSGRYDNAGGRVHSAGISYPEIADWREENGSTITWGHDVVGQESIVAPSWIALVVIGELRAEDGFRDIKPAARQSLECMASSEYYPGRTGFSITSSKEHTVSGRPAWWVRGEVRVADRAVEGDVIDTIVIDLGDGRLAFCATQAAIGQPQTQAIIDAAIAGLAVD